MTKHKQKRHFYSAALDKKPTRIPQQHKEPNAVQPDVFFSCDHLRDEVSVGRREHHRQCERLDPRGTLKLHLRVDALRGAAGHRTALGHNADASGREAGRRIIGAALPFFGPPHFHPRFQLTRTTRKQKSIGKGSYPWPHNRVQVSYCPPEKDPMFVSMMQCSQRPPGAAPG
jgi:hypothetical protein